METNQQNWKPTDLHISMIGPEIKDELVLEMKATNPARFREIQDLEIDIVSDTDEIVQNDKGELALFSKGTYYPLQSGKWIIPEPVTYEKEDWTEETVYEDWDFNYYIAIDGIRFLLMIEPVNPWYNLQKTNGKYIAKGDEKILHKCNDEIREKGNRNSKYKSSDYLFDLEILPEPFWGDIRNAEVFILSGNPGLGDDEKDFNNNVTFKNATLDNISLDKPKIVWLDQEYKKDIVYNGKPHPGFEYWEKKTQKLREAIANLSKCNIEDVKLNICIIEYFPYHSKKISSKMKTEGPKLPSSKFVDYYIEKAIHDKKWIVIARCKKDWTHRINGHWMDCKLEDYKNSGKVLITHSQQMYLTPRNLVNKDELKNYEKCPENAPTWKQFVKACKK